MAYYHLLSEILAAQGEPEKTIEAYNKLGGPPVEIGGISTLIMSGVHLRQRVWERASSF
jgi:hypothetical protein